MLCKSLRCIVLSVNAIDDDAMDVLLPSLLTGPEDLKSLYLNDNLIGARGARGLANGLDQLPSLNFLALGNNPCSEDQDVLEEVRKAWIAAGKDLLGLQLMNL